MNINDYLITIALTLVTLQVTAQSDDVLRIATFNVSIEASNYSETKQINIDNVSQLLTKSTHPQIKNIAEIIQRTRPDVLLLNEFDYIQDPKKGILAFIKNYLNQAQNDALAIDYPYWYIAHVNSGKPSPYDLNKDGSFTGSGADAWGYGEYQGQYAMALLSRYPIDIEKVRTLQNFSWHSMPNALKPTSTDSQNSWYSPEAWQSMPLSSKSHWDVPIMTPSGIIHIIAAHPTPPTFDGEEDRNGKRNHDEIRLITDYITNQNYIYDDHGVHGGLQQNTRFIILGDLNSSPNEGDSIKFAIQELLSNPMVNADCKPQSMGGKLNNPQNPFAQYHTASWGLRVDYVLPSRFGIALIDCGVYWPVSNSSESRLVLDRAASSDHRLVWADIKISSD